jgi:hypothetical protein
MQTLERLSVKTGQSPERRMAEAVGQHKQVVQLLTLMGFLSPTRTMVLQSAGHWTRVKASSSERQTAETAGWLKLRLEHLFSPQFPLPMLIMEPLSVSVIQPSALQTVEVPGAANTAE